MGSGVGLGVSVGTCGDVGAGAGVVASSRASARPVARAVALARVVARQHGLGGDSGTPLAWAAAARTCRVVVESRKARRAQRDEGSEAREAMRGKRCEGSEAVGSEATGAMPAQAKMAKSADFLPVLSGLIARWNTNQGKGWCAGFNVIFSMRANGDRILA